MPATAALPAHITIGDLDFTVRASEHRHTVGITVDRDGSLLLHAPTGSDPDAVASWARSARPRTSSPEKASATSAATTGSSSPATRPVPTSNLSAAACGCPAAQQKRARAKTQ